MKTNTLERNVTCVMISVGVSVVGVSAVGVSVVGVSVVGVSAVGVSAVGVSVMGVSAVGVSVVGVSAVGVSVKRSSSSENTLPFSFNFSETYLSMPLATIFSDELDNNELITDYIFYTET